jgi:serine/threonine-protein kinase RsbT
VADEIRIAVASEIDLVAARREGRRLALELGFSSTDATLVATAISEVARNVLIHAAEGFVDIGAIRDRGRLGISVVAKDEGPGIADLELAMTDGYSTRGGFGFGLPGARRLMDEFHIVSQKGEGTTVTMIKWRAGGGLS